MLNDWPKQIYEAWCKELYVWDGDPQPPWDALPRPQQQAWLYIAAKIQRVPHA